MDIQIGSTVSLVLVSHQEERDVDAIARNPEEFGLHTFCSAAILSQGDDLLGTLEVLCCDPRTPTVNEALIIERVAGLAAVAIQRGPRELLN
jgi:GAF domain-containing protein